VYSKHRCDYNKGPGNNDQIKYQTSRKEDCERTKENDKHLGCSLNTDVIITKSQETRIESSIKL